MNGATELIYIGMDLKFTPTIILAPETLSDKSIVWNIEIKPALIHRLTEKQGRDAMAAIAELLRNLLNHDQVLHL